MLAPLMFVEGSVPDQVSDLVALGIALATLFGLMWAAVTRATKPLRDRLDEIHALAEGLQAERERVDDLSDRVTGMERRLGVIERRIEDLYQLLLTMIDPRRMRHDHHAPLEEDPPELPTND